MITEKEQSEYGSLMFGIGIFAGGICTFFFMLFIWDVSDTKMKKEAIQNNVAFYDCNPTTGVSEFKFITLKKEEKKLEK